MSESILIATSEYEALKKRNEQIVKEQNSSRPNKTSEEKGIEAAERESSLSTIAQNKVVIPENEQRQKDLEPVTKDDKSDGGGSDLSSNDSDVGNGSSESSSVDESDAFLHFLPRKDIKQARQLVRALLTHPQVQIGTDGMLSIRGRDLGHILLHLQLLYGNQKQIQQDKTYFRRFLQKTGLCNNQQNSKKERDQQSSSPPVAKKSKKDVKTVRKKAEKIVMRNLDTFLK